MTPFALDWSSLEVVVFCTKLLLCVSTVVPATEYLVISSAFKPDGVLSGTMMSLSDTGLNLLPKRATKALFSYPAFVGLNLTRIVLCVALLFAPATISFYILLALTLTSVLFFHRNPLGNDGSDQMSLVVCIALTILYSQYHDGVIAKVSICFIAAQSILAYFVAGFAKLISPVWRSGEAVRRIMNTRTYGDFTVAKYLNTGRSAKLANLSLCWNVILMETLFPLILFLPAPYFWIFMAWGLLFHLYNAIVMGLNVFFWAFIATYPSILYLRTIIQAGG